jgi:hypothetical protein
MVRRRVASLGSSHLEDHRNEIASVGIDLGKNTEECRQKWLNDRQLIEQTLPIECVRSPKIDWFTLAECARIRVKKRASLLRCAQPAGFG